MSTTTDLYFKAIESLNNGKAYAEWQREQERLAFIRALNAAKSRAIRHD